MITLLEFLQKKHIDIDEIEEWVDLDLPPSRPGNLTTCLWCSHNIGAKNPEDNGDYFAWGENEPKIEFTEKNYKFFDNQTNSINYPDRYDYERTDVAHKLYHKLYDKDVYTPTYYQCVNLFNNTTQTKETINGKLCIVFTSKTNKESLIIPYSGYIRESILLKIFILTTSDDIDYDCAKAFYINGALGSSPLAIIKYYGSNIRPVKTKYL